MQTILCMNPKGGCGKTTIATNLAVAYANRGQDVALLDNDPQAASTFWGEQRAPELPRVPVVPAHRLPSTNGVLDARGNWLLPTATLWLGPSLADNTLQALHQDLPTNQPQGHQAAPPVRPRWLGDLHYCASASRRAPSLTIASFG